MEKELSDSLPKPNFNKKRPRCPFYGFSYPFMQTFMDQDGNQCPLYTDSYTPCQMETHNLLPDWEACSFFNIKKNEKAISAIREMAKIAPNEFEEELPFGEWMNHIMNKNH